VSNISTQTLIEPIGEVQRQQVTRATDECIARANDLLDTNFGRIPVRFDLTGRAAGMYHVARGCRSIRYNPYMFAKYFDENYTTTIPHEVAHYLTESLYGRKKPRPHGAQWRTVMQMLGADANVHCNFDLDGIPIRRYRRVRYICRCQTHELTRVRHNRVQKKGARYYCRLCRTELLLSDDQLKIA
jgi:SprT protein